MPEIKHSQMPTPETPGPRNPDPLPPANPAGYVTVPSDEDVAPGAIGDDPHNPPPGGPDSAPVGKIPTP